ncbi:MAG: pyridoxamine 5'-phosphate oxidase family protein [Clostridia bacterium]|nr:pyridoxamine 5'-phosphate oxidase family protein [Clostridia bacterium]
MTKQEIFDLINQNPAFHLATLEDNQPRVRGMLIYKADESGIVFHTGAFKDLYSQVLKNPKAELCFNDYQKGIQLRVSGELETVDDNRLKDEIAAHPTRTFLKPWRERITLEEFYKLFKVLRLKNGKATLWTMETNTAPKEYITL